MAPEAVAEAEAVAAEEFRNFNPTQPHGAIFYQGGFPALQAQQSSTTSLLALATDGIPVAPQPDLSSQQNRFGITYTGSPYIPGLTKPSTKQFVFINITGVRNISLRNFTGTVPTLAERGETLVNGVLTPTDADLSALAQRVNGVLITPPLYNPATQQQFANNIIPAALITPQARALLNYYPLPNIAGSATQNYQDDTTVGSNTTQGSARFVRNFGAAGFGPFGGGGGRRAAANAPKTLRQTVNVAFSFSHSASGPPQHHPHPRRQDFLGRLRPHRRPHRQLRPHHQQCLPQLEPLLD